jgi:hypothetical protein
MPHRAREAHRSPGARGLAIRIALAVNRALGRRGRVWADGFREPTPRSKDPPPVCRPRTWLARVGWRRRGLLRTSERPAASV